MVIGITGSIATGKSACSSYILSKGYILVDSDRLAYDALTIDTNCIEAVFELFDCKDENGKINRAKLANIIFHDSDKKKQLEGIVHPYVIHHIQEVIKAHPDELVFLDIPLLYEGHFEYLCDSILVVYVSEETQLTRLMQRNGYTKEEAYSRINNQISVEKKAKLADYVINNEGTLEQLHQKIDLLLDQLEGK